MKKKMAVASGLLLTAILLTGCGGDKEDQLVGKWNATKVKVEDTEVSMDAFLEQLGDPRMKMSLEFLRMEMQSVISWVQRRMVSGKPTRTEHLRLRMKVVIQRSRLRMENF